MSGLWRCNECEAVHAEHHLLTAPSPFDASQTLVGCPACKSVGAFTNVCDEPGCGSVASCGWPTLDGRYRWTCGFHMREGER